MLLSRNFHSRCLQSHLNLNAGRIKLSRFFSTADSNGNDKSKTENEENLPEKSTETKAKQNDLTAKSIDDKVITAKKKLTDLLESMKLDTSIGKPIEAKVSLKLAKPDPEQRKKRYAVPKIPVPEISEVSKDIDKRLSEAAKLVSQTLTESRMEAKKVESELLTMLKTQVKQPRTKLTEMLGEMKIDKSKTKGTAGRQQMIDDTVDVDMNLSFKLKPPTLPLPKSKSLNRDYRFSFNDEQSLNLFNKNLIENENQPSLPIWKHLEKHELEMCITHTPKNAYEEMIKWTEEGKLWQYPIDNEQGLEEEANVPFYEHVLLDHFLEDFQKGPIRDFMELVIIGLSKNPFITVERKHATIEYYRKYFDEKESLLKTVEFAKAEIEN